MTNEELALRIQGGEKERIPELWMQVKGLAFRTASRYLKTHFSVLFEMEDFEEAAYKALLKSVAVFQPDKGNFAALYRWKLRGEYHIFLTVNTPKHPTASLDEPILEDVTLGDAIPDERAEQALDDALERTFRDGYRDVLADALDRLPPRQKSVIVRHFFGGKTMKAIATEDGVCMSAIQQSLSGALRNLRKNSELRRLAHADP